MKYLFLLSEKFYRLIEWQWNFLKRLRRKSPLDINKPIVKASKHYKVGGKNRQDRSSHVDSKWIKAHKKKGEMNVKYF